MSNENNYDYWKTPKSIVHTKRQRYKKAKNPNVLTGVPCKHPECNTILTATELVMSDYCFKHQLEVNQNKTI